MKIAIGEIFDEVFFIDKSLSSRDLKSVYVSLTSFAASMLSFTVANSIIFNHYSGFILFFMDYLLTALVVFVCFVLYVSLIHLVSDFLSYSGSSYSIVLGFGVKSWPFHFALPVSIVSLLFSGGIFIYIAGLFMVFLLLSINLKDVISINYNIKTSKAAFLMVSPLLLFFIPLSLFIIYLLIYYA